MSKKKPLSRREFIKLGALAAISLPTIHEKPSVDIYSHNQILEEYGGFLIRKNDPDDPPYQVDDAVYQRFDARNSALGRISWDDEAKLELFSNQRTVTEMLSSGKPGFHKEDYALQSAGWTVAKTLGSNAAMHGLHKGLLQLNSINQEQINADISATPWDQFQLKNEEVTQKIKKAAKFYGASLVGITELDERWVYEKSFDSASPDKSGEIIFMDADQIEPLDPEAGKQAVQDALTEMEPEDLKEYILSTLEEIDPDDLPPGAPDPFIVKTLPASQIAQMVPLMMKMLPESLLSIFAQKLGIPFGAVEVNPEAYSRPRYLQNGTILVIPKTMQWVIVMAFEMDADAIACSPTATGAATVGSGYSRMTVAASSLAEFIRILGYHAIPCVDMTALSIPLAVDAGLGEMGRNGMLITPKYGPRVQLAKIITDMPLVADQPISFGVDKFCELCQKCAEHCPGQAIFYEEPNNQALNVSNNPGVTKWPVDAIKCLSVAQSLGSAICSTCIQVCPFNKPEGWLHDVTRTLIDSKQDSINKLIINLSGPSNKDEQTDPKVFWGSENFIHIKEP